VGDDAHSHELLSVIAAVHHERVCQSLDDRALRLAESLDGIAAGRVGDVDRRADLDVVAVIAVELASGSCYPLSDAHQVSRQFCSYVLMT